MKKKTEKLATFNLSFFKGVEVILARDIANEFRRHIHRTFIVGQVTKGVRVIRFSGHQYRIRKNEIFIINPDEVHSCGSMEPVHSYQILSVAPQAMHSIASQISDKNETLPYFEKIHYKDKRLSENLINVFDVIKSPDSDIQAESGIYSFLSFLITTFSTNPPKIPGIGDQKDAVKRACDYIQQNYIENLSLKKLAQIACLSPFHFQREFKKHVGITPHEYVSDLKISKSKQMLLESKNISDVALHFGFFDQSHFSRVFKKTVGVSPGNYLETNQ